MIVSVDVHDLETALFEVRTFVDTAGHRFVVLRVTSTDETTPDIRVDFFGRSPTALRALAAVAEEAASVLDAVGPPPLPQPLQR